MFIKFRVRLRSQEQKSSQSRTYLRGGRKTVVHLTYLHAAAFYCLPTLLTITKACVPWLEPSTLTHTEAYYHRRPALQTLESFQKGHMLLLKD